MGKIIALLLFVSVSCLGLFSYVFNGLWLLFGDEFHNDECEENVSNDCS